MEEADDGVEARDLEHLAPAHAQNAADEHSAQMLGPVRRPVGEQHGAGRRDRVDDADHRLLGDVALSTPGEGQDEGAEDGEPEPAGIGFPGLQVEAEEEGGGGAQGGDLGQRDVDEDDFSGDDMKPEVGVDAGQHEAHQERHPHQRQEVAGHELD